MEFCYYIQNGKYENADWRDLDVEEKRKIALVLKTKAMEAAGYEKREIGRFREDTNIFRREF